MLVLRVQRQDHHVPAVRVALLHLRHGRPRGEPCDRAAFWHAAGQGQRCAHLRRGGQQRHRDSGRWAKPARHAKRAAHPPGRPFRARRTTSPSWNSSTRWWRPSTATSRTWCASAPLPPHLARWRTVSAHVPPLPRSLVPRQDFCARHTAACTATSNPHAAAVFVPSCLATDSLLCACRGRIRDARLAARREQCELDVSDSAAAATIARLARAVRALRPCCASTFYVLSACRYPFPSRRTSTRSRAP